MPTTRICRRCGCLTDDVPIVVTAAGGRRRYRRCGGRRPPGSSLSSRANRQIGNVTVRAVPARHDGRRWRRGPHTTAALGYVVVGRSADLLRRGHRSVPGSRQWVGACRSRVVARRGLGSDAGRGPYGSAARGRRRLVIGARRTVPIHYGTLWPIGMDSVRPGKFFGPGADFVRRARRDGLDVCELLPGDYLGEQFRT